MYVGVGALTAAEKTSFEELTPKCYTREFDDCWHEKDLESYPNCRLVNQLWGKDQQWADKVVEDIPFCSAAKMKEDKIIWAAGAGLLGLVLGILAGAGR